MGEDKTKKDFEKVQSKIIGEQVLKDKLPECLKQKQVKVKKVSVLINPKIKSLANICSSNDMKDRDTWIEDLILNEASAKHKIILPEFSLRVVNDNR